MQDSNVTRDTVVKPALTIVMPVYNGIEFIKEAVDSVLTQSFTDWELIISDNCSKDETPAYLDTLTDPRIRAYKQENNLGIFGNLNFLFQQARSEHTLILCHDDYLLPGGLEAVNNTWNSLSDSVGFVRFNWDPNTNREYALPPTIRPHEAIAFFFVYGNIMGNISNVSVRTSLVINAGGFRADLPYAGDFDFWSRMSQQVDIALSKDKVSYIRRHPNAGSFNLNRRGELVNQLFIVVNYLYEEMQRQHPSWINQLFANMVFDVFQRDAAVRSLIHTKNFAYLQQLSVARKPFHLPEGVRWMLYCTSLGGRWLGPARFIASRILANNKKGSPRNDQPSALSKQGQYDV